MPISSSPTRARPNGKVGSPPPVCASVAAETVDAGRKSRSTTDCAVAFKVIVTSRAVSAPLGTTVWWMTADEPAFQAALVTVELLPHATDTVELLPFAVTVNVPEPPGPVSQMSDIVSSPAAGIGVGVGFGVGVGVGVGVAVGVGVGVVDTVVANAVDEIAITAPPATTAAKADFKIDIITLLSLTVIAVFVPRTLPSVFR